MHQAFIISIEYSRFFKFLIHLFQGVRNAMKKIQRDEKYCIVVGNTGQGTYSSSTNFMYSKYK